MPKKLFLLFNYQIQNLQVKRLLMFETASLLKSIHKKNRKVQEKVFMLMIEKFLTSDFVEVSFIIASKSYLRISIGGPARYIAICKRAT